MSFSSSTALTFPSRGWSLRWNEAFFGEQKWIGSVWVSLRVAFCTMIVTTLAGVAAAYGLHQSGFRLSGAIRATLISPLAVPSILIAVGMFFVYATIDGLLNTTLGLVLGHSVVAMPFVILTMSAGFSSFDMSQEMVARSLGANRFKAFMTVTLPLLKPGLANAFLVGFIESMADFGNPIVVGGQFSVLSTEIFFAIVGAQYDQGRAASLAWILTTDTTAITETKL